MTEDLLELDDLSLADDITTRRRLFDIRCVKRKFSNRKVVFTQSGFILQEYLQLDMESHWVLYFCSIQNKSTDLIFKFYTIEPYNWAADHLKSKKFEESDRRDHVESLLQFILVSILCLSEPWNLL